MDEESADMLSDHELNVMIAETSDEASSTSTGCIEPDLETNDPEWKGVSIEEIHKHNGPFNWQHLPPIQSLPSHTILFDLPLPFQGPPKPHLSQPADKWHQNFVRMPHSVHSLYPIEPEKKNCNKFRRRWEVIQEALLQSFISSEQLESAILSFNHKYAERWDFAALHYFFNEYVEEDGMKICFSSLMPKMIQLALQLPDLVTAPIPLLKRHSNRSISLSQLQVASLLANAFFCTFPRRNSTNPQSEYASFPYINFNRLFASFREDRKERNQSVMEKLKCIFHYFRRVTSKAPEGTITIQRKFIPRKSCPRWDKQHIKLPPLHITSKGTIESQGAGLLQVDFANKFVGGGVLNYGCVQEEIRFVICPELLVTMLITEALDDTEALVIKGVERYSRYTGYSNTFKWIGDFVDQTPKDSSGRLKTCIVAIDALYFKQPLVQFSMGNIIRELNKAYIGFSSEEASNDLPAIATGNWGCGAFRGNPQLKVLVQLMAAAVAGRSMIYFTFGDESLRDIVAEMYWHLVKHDVDVGRLFALISQYQETLGESRSDFYRFLYNRSRIKPLTHYFSKSPSKIAKSQDFRSNKTTESKLNLDFDIKVHASMAKMKEDALEHKIEEWLESTEDDFENGNGFEKLETDEEMKDENKNVEIKVQEDVACVEDSPVVEVTRSPRKRKRQIFSEIFGDKRSDVLPEKRISNLEIFDQLLLETTKEKFTENDESMEIDTMIEKIQNQDLRDMQTSKTAEKMTKITKNPSQMKISDFFKKQST